MGTAGVVTAPDEDQVLEGERARITGLLSTRFFWGASYGQIYPELRRLEAAGLVRAKEEPRGGVRRRVYSLTPKGERAVRAWLLEPVEAFELRDEVRAC